MPYRKVSYMEQAFYLLRYKLKEIFSLPRKPLKPCKVPGCPNLTEGMYCEKHKDKDPKIKYEAEVRDKVVHSRRYGPAWKRIRDSYVKSHPYCEECYKKGILVPVEEVHHKVPLSEGGTHSRDNLVSLCHSCHAKIHEERFKRKEYKF